MVKKAYPLIIFSAIAFLVFFSPVKASAATLSLVPDAGTYEKGQSISIRVLAASSTPFNAISGTVSFPTSIFSIDSISKAGSVLDFWVTEPSISKSAGTVKFEGVSLGGSGKYSGTVITVNLHAINTGSGKASFQAGQILANDGEGTDITSGLNVGNYTAGEATTPIPTTPTPTPSNPKPKPNTPTPTTPKPTPTPEPTQPLPTLHAPQISLGTKYGAEAIIGTSDYPNAQALVTFIAEDGSKVFILGTSDSSGEFNLTVPTSLKLGTYTVNAVMIKEDKTNSETSNVITVKIGNILSDISLVMSVIIFMLILLVIYLILRIHYHFGQSNNTNTNVKRAVGNAENVLHKSFDIIREDVIDYDNKKISAAEHKRMSSIKKDIIDAEKVIDKEIKDIGS